jgi:predicted aconitase with swiveling domain
MILKGRGLVEGSAAGPLVVSSQPLSFLGGVDPDSGVVVDRGHELYGKKLTGTLLAIPHTVGSSVGAYVIYNLKKKSLGPAGFVAVKGDITLVSGCALAGVPLADGFRLEDLAGHAGKRAVLSGSNGELFLDLD